ncbi:MAG: hypothetical protein IIV56_06035, partial [Mailhella sp.]|nr:hypothetical protein [Mailhella sp.]
MSQIGNIQNGPQLQPEQDVQSTQNTAVQQTEQKPRTAPSRGISKMSDGYREVLPSDPNKFKMFEKYLTPPERTGFEQFCKGVERITESWFKTKGSQIRAKEDFDHIAAKLVMNFHKCWVNESIDATDKKAFVSLLEDLRLEARILGMNPEQFCGRVEDCFTVAAKSFVDADFFLSAHVYMNTTSDLKDQFKEVFKSIDPSNTLSWMAAKLTLTIHDELTHKEASGAKAVNGTSPQPAENNQEVKEAKNEIAHKKKEIQKRVDTALDNLENAKVELGELKEKLQKVSELSVTERFTLRNQLMDKLQSHLGSSVVEAYQALHAKGVAGAVRDVKTLSTEDLLTQMANMLNETAPAPEKTPVSEVQDKKLNFYEESALKLKQNVQDYCKHFSEIFELLDMRELEARSLLEADYQGLLLPAKDFKFKPLTDLLSMQISPDEAEAAKSRYKQCHAQLMAMFSDIGKPSFNPSKEQLRALAELDELKQFFPGEQQVALNKLKTALNRYVSL